MPYQPMFPSPYMQTIDATKEDGNTFKCLINPRDIIAEYSLIITKTDSVEPIVTIVGGLDSAGKQFKTINGDTVTVDDTDSPLPVYGGEDDSGWLKVKVPYEYTPIGSTEAKQSGIVNGVDYVWKIALKGDVFSENDYVNTSATPSRKARYKLTYAIDGPGTKWSLAVPKATRDECIKNGATGFVIRAVLKTRTEYLWIGDWSEDNYPIIYYNSVIDSAYKSFCQIIEIGCIDKYGCFSSISKTSEKFLYQGATNLDYVIQFKYNKSFSSEFLSLNYFKGKKVSKSETAWIDPLIFGSSSYNSSDESWWKGLTEDGEPINYNFENGVTYVDFSDTTYDSFELYVNGSISPDYYFLTSTPIVLSFNSIPETITSNYIKVSTTITGPKTSIVSYVYNLYLNGEIIDTTGDVYSPNIRPYEYGNLVSGQSYYLECIVTDINNDTIKTDTAFDVLYENYQTLVSPLATYNTKNSCVDLDFSQNSSILGEINSGKAEYKTVKNPDGSVGEKCLSLSTEQVLSYNTVNEYNPLDLDGNSFAFVWHGNGYYPSGRVPIFELINSDGKGEGDNIIVGVEDGYLYYKKPLDPNSFYLSDVMYYNPYKNEYNQFPSTAQDVGRKTLAEQKVIKSVNTWNSSTRIKITIPWNSGDKGFDNGDFILYNDETYGITEAAIDNENKLKSFVIYAPKGQCTIEVGDTIISYKKNTIYELGEKTELSDSDILFSNDMLNKYWYLIVVNCDPDKINSWEAWSVKIYPIAPYFKTEAVTENV